jgi:C4-dicarboxylate transporter DctM subunit
VLVIVVIGGIYTGIFTPTEAAAISAVYAFFVAVFVYKDMSIKQVPKVLLDSANMSAMLLYIITNAVMFSYLMTSEQIPQELAAWMLDKGLGVIAFLLFVNIVLLLAGNVMEPSSIVLIMAPILFPGGDEARHRPRSLRHHDGGQHGSGDVPPARRTQSLRCVGHYQDGHH